MTKATTKAEEEKPISIRKFARQMGVAHTAVIYWINTGRIVKGVCIPNPQTGQRKIIASIAKKEVEETADATQNFRAENARKNSNRKESKGGQPQTEAEALEAKKGALNQIKTTKEELIVEQKRIELAKLRGDLVDRDKVQKTLFAFGKILREKILNVPERITDNLFASGSREEIYNTLLEALEDALQDLSNTEEIKFDQ